jgi:hypothetical protein
VASRIVRRLDYLTLWLMPLNGCRENIDPSQQVVRRDHLVEAKLVKQLPLISVLPPHHRRLSAVS